MEDQFIAGYMDPETTIGNIIAYETIQRLGLEDLIDWEDEYTTDTGFGTVSLYGTIQIRWSEVMIDGQLHHMNKTQFHICNAIRIEPYEAILGISWIEKHKKSSMLPPKRAAEKHKKTSVLPPERAGEQSSKDRKGKNQQSSKAL